MVKINSNLLNLNNDYNVYSNVTKKVNEFKKENPDVQLVSLGIGDVSKPIVEPVVRAMKQAADDLSDYKTFKGYGAYYGYDFLKSAILENEYKDFNFSLDEIYISDGTKTDSTSILELFDINSKICIIEPMYPIYRDGAKSLNRKVEIIETSSCNDFIPKVPTEHFDIIYMCSPSNPVGRAYSYKELKEWVDYAKEHKSVILYDNVYSSFVRSSDVPKTIYEIDGAKEVAIEFKSFSKNASFTGIRCSYYIIPNNISENINEIWKNRIINRFNGASYISQRGAEATYLQESQILIKNNMDYYHDNASILKNAFESVGFELYGGFDSPYMWVKTKNNLSSWEMFDIFLKELNIVIIPGIIFGSSGEHYFRISALGTIETTNIAIERLKKYYEK